MWPKNDRKSWLPLNIACCCADWINPLEFFSWNNPRKFNKNTGILFLTRIIFLMIFFLICQNEKEKIEDSCEKQKLLGR